MNNKKLNADPKGMQQINFTENLENNAAISFIKINDHNHPEYVTTQKFDKLTSESFVARFSQVKLASKNYIVHLVKKTDLMINKKFK